MCHQLRKLLFLVSRSKINTKNTKIYHENFKIEKKNYNCCLKTTKNNIM